ncbi:MAG: hypothetical protein LBD68_00195 [Zoogloeaceae bacterium]|nr:hypothetical protein [Zoogloeaceae bacterium]
MKNIFLRRLILPALFLLPGMGGAAQICSVETLKTLAVEEVQVRFTKERGDAHVETIGILRNKGQEKVEDIRLVTRHLDAEGRLLDVQQNYLYGVTLAPGEDMPFRFRQFATQPQPAYASHDTRVAGAYCAYNEAEETEVASASGKTSDSILGKLGKLLADVWPILLLIAVLFLVTRKYSGARSPVVQAQERQLKFVERQLELMERQIALLERQGEWSAQNNALFERIATALEDRNKS